MSYDASNNEHLTLYMYLTANTITELVTKALIVDDCANLMHCSLVICILYCVTKILEREQESYPINNMAIIHAETAFWSPFLVQ